MWCPLKHAVNMGHEKVVKMLLDRGLEALGGNSLILPRVISDAVLKPRARILHMLLSAEGEGRRAYWANLLSGANLQRAAAQSNLAMVGVLMANGADENQQVSTLDGRTARDMVAFKGMACNIDVPEINAAISRMLERGPAFRARSWAYPSFLAVVGVDDDRGGVGANARHDNLRAGGARQCAIRVRIYRPKSRSMMARLLHRHFAPRQGDEGVLALAKRR